ncbi:MAG: glycolate oxidase subunit GlcE, partial [Pseudomonadota bacterium]
GLMDAQCIEWGGGLRWIKTSAPAQQIREIARALGGHATLFRTVHPEMRSRIGAFSEISPAIMKIHQRLKQELDPNSIFNPGRLIAGL